VQVRGKKPLEQPESTGVLEQFGHARSDVLGRGHGGEPCDDVALAVDEELLEVPRDVGRVGCLRLEPRVELARTVAVDLDLREQGEGAVVLRGRELEDLGVSARFLRTELVAREPQDGEALVLVVFVERTQTCVLRGEASSARNVDDEQDRAGVVAEVHGVAGDRRHREVMDVCHGRTLSDTRAPRTKSG
jgi:hypothetical protein